MASMFATVGPTTGSTGCGAGCLVFMKNHAGSRGGSAEVSDETCMLEYSERFRELKEKVLLGRNAHGANKDNNWGNLEDLYEVHKDVALGEGTFGAVWRLTHKQTSADRALKTIPFRAARAIKGYSYEREISIVAQLDHPNIIRLVDTFADATALHLVFELCTGGELFDRIVGGASDGFTEREAANYIRQLLEALCYLHGLNIVHRDLKLENLLLEDTTPSATLKLIDFGVARHVAPGSKVSTMTGTSYYVAPEVLRGSYNESCDIWSSGVIGFMFLCGYAPFNGRGDFETMAKVKTGSFEFQSPYWDHISQGAKNLVTQMLTVDTSARPDAEHLLVSSWLR